MSRPIVVGVDGLAPSRTAFVSAIALARVLDAEVVMAYASESPESAVSNWLPVSTVLGYRERLEESLASARIEISELREQFTGRGVEISQSFVSGPADEGIVTVALKHDAALVVVGSHGRRGLDRVFLGSVAERVVRSAHCDVLVVRGEPRFDKPNRILVPVDFSAASKRALAVAGGLANGGVITLLHCFDTPPLSDGVLIGKLFQDQKEALGHELDELAQPTRDAGVKVETLALAGYAPGLIAQHANDHDLIVMGSHGRRGVRRWLLGSVAEKTIRRAPCSVYIARASPSGEPAGGDE